MEQIFFCVYMKLSICGFELGNFVENIFCVGLTHMLKCEVELGI